MIGGSPQRGLLQRACPHAHRARRVGSRFESFLPFGLVLSGLVIFALACSGSDPDGHTAFSATPAPSPTWEMLNSLGSPPPSEASSSDLSAVENELRASYEIRYASYWECLRSPHDCDQSYLFPAGQAAQQISAVLSEMVARDRFVGPEAVGYHSIESLWISNDRRRAEVTACWWSTAVLYGAPVRPDLPAGPDNPNTLVTSTPEGGRQNDRFVWTQGQWLLVATEALDAGFAQDPCTK